MSEVKLNVLNMYTKCEIFHNVLVLTFEYITIIFEFICIFLYETIFGNDIYVPAVRIPTL